VGALVLVCVGVVLILLALDARNWHTTVTRDDLRFRALPAHRSLWTPQTALPGDPVGSLLDANRAIEFRHALQLFWFSRAGVNPESQVDLPTLRAQAQARLGVVAATAPLRQERSDAANLLGVLVVTTPIVGSDQNAVTQMLRTAIGDFQNAIALDPTNTDAKQNLELVLRLTRPGTGDLGKDARAGYGFGKGRGAAPLGGGY
jgi:hypothetical protein